MEHSEEALALRARREAILQIHLDGETNMDADAVVGTMVEEAVYELPSIDRTLHGHDEIRGLLELMFRLVPGVVHRPVAFHHADDNVIVEVETEFPNGLDGKRPGEVQVLKTIGVFPFQGERSLGERVYSDATALLPHLDPSPVR